MSQLDVFPTNSFWGEQAAESIKGKGRPCPQTGRSCERHLQGYMSTAAPFPTGQSEPVTRGKEGLPLGRTEMRAPGALSSTYICIHSSPDTAKYTVYSLGMIGSHVPGRPALHSYQLIPCIL